jgi:hypothetical protein
MFATTITACRLSRMDSRPGSWPPVTPYTAIRDTHVASAPTRVDRINQRPRRAQALHRQPIRRRRNTPIGPLLAHGHPPPPLDLTHEEQPCARAQRVQHGQALPTQRMKRVSDYQ